MDPNSYKNYSMFTDQVNENNGHYSYPSYTTSEASTYQTQNVESSCYYGNQQPSYGMENNHQQVDPASYCNQQTVNSNYYGNSQSSMHSQNGDQQMLNYSGVPTSERQQSAPDNSNPNNCSLQPPPSSVPWTQQSTSESVQPSDPLKQSRASHTGTSKVTKRKKAPRKKDVSKPQKPVSAYAHFFREKQTEIKTRNPDASFGEVSKIVAQEWESLPNQMKVVYKRKADQEKQEYLRAVATFKANIVAGNVAESSLPSAEGSADKTKAIAGVEQVAASQPPSTNMDQQAGHPQSIPTSSAPDESWMSEIDANLVWSPLSSEALNNSNTAQHQPNQTQLNYSNNNNPGGWPNEYYNNGDGSINPCKDVFDDWLDARQSSVTNH